MNDDRAIIGMPPDINIDSVEKIKTQTVKSYEGQIADISYDRYYEDSVEPIEKRIASDLKKRLDKEFKTNFNVIVGSNFGYDIKLPPDLSNNRFEFKEPTNNGMYLKILIYECNVYEAKFMM